jgi:hypothetical protein
MINSPSYQVSKSKSGGFWGALKGGIMGGLTGGPAGAVMGAMGGMNPDSQFGQIMNLAQGIQGQVQNKKMQEGLLGLGSGTQMPSLNQMQMPMMAQYAPQNYEISSTGLLGLGGFQQQPMQLPFGGGLF